MGEDILRVLQSLRHLCVVALQGLIQGQGLSLALFIDIGNQPVLRVEQDLGMVLEIDLHNFIAEPEHDGMLSAHPLLDIDLGSPTTQPSQFHLLLSLLRRKFHCIRIGAILYLFVVGVCL